MLTTSFSGTFTNEWQHGDVMIRLSAAFRDTVGSTQAMCILPTSLRKTTIKDLAEVACHRYRTAITSIQDKKTRNVSTETPAIMGDAASIPLAPMLYPEQIEGTAVRYIGIAPDGAFLTART